MTFSRAVPPEPFILFGFFGALAYFLWRRMGRQRFYSYGLGLIGLSHLLDGLASLGVSDDSPTTPVIPGMLRMLSLACMGAGLGALAFEGAPALVRRIPKARAWLRSRRAHAREDANGLAVPARQTY